MKVPDSQPSKLKFSIVHGHATAVLLALHISPLCPIPDLKGPSHRQSLQVYVTLGLCWEKKGLPISINCSEDFHRGNTCEVIWGHQLISEQSPKRHHHIVKPILGHYHPGQDFLTNNLLGKGSKILHIHSHRVWWHYNLPPGGPRQSPALKNVCWNHAI